MTVSTTVMKIIDINVTTENAILKLNSLVKRTSNGEDLNVYPRNGFAMVINLLRC